MIKVLLTFLIAFCAPAPGALHFETTELDLGDRPRLEREIAFDFPFVNTSSHDVRIAYAVASCSCTQLSWTTEAVPPGGTGKVSALYNIERYTDSFHKSITVMVDGESSPYILRFSGSIYDTPQSLFTDFRYRRSALGLESDPLRVGVVHSGSEQNGRVELCNFSDKSIELEFKDITPGLILSYTSKTIEPVSRTYFSYSFIPDSLSRGPFAYSFTPVLDGEPLAPYKIETIVVDDFSSLTSAERNSSAIPKLAASEFSFGEIASGARASVDIVLLNSTDFTAKIQSVSSSREGLEFSYPEVLEAKSSTVVKASVVPGKLRSGSLRFKVTIVTSSPLVPLLETWVTGYVK